MDTQLRAGIAVYNAGAYHAAHDAWEDHWLDLPDGTDDERFLHGLIQFTAAVYHATTRNWSGAVGLTKSSRGYLAALDSPYRGVDLTTIRTYLRALEIDPERIERAVPPQVRYKGRPLAAADLSAEGITIAAGTIAEDHEGYNEQYIEQAARYARAEVNSSHPEFIGLLATFVDEAAHRGIVYDRLAAKVERRQQKQQDVAGLFEPRDDRD